MAPAEAAVTSGKAYNWGYNYNGRIGNGTTGIVSDAPVGVKNSTHTRNTDGGYSFTLALVR